MADSQSGEKSRVATFRDQIGDLALAHKTAAGIAVVLLLFPGWFLSLVLTAYIWPPENSLFPLVITSFLYPIVTLLVIQKVLGWDFFKRSENKTADDVKAETFPATCSASPVPVGNNETYETISFVIAFITFLITFIGSWLYCIATYGYLLGVGLGWLPSVITAFIVAFLARWLWPFIVLGVLYLWFTSR